MRRLLLILGMIACSACGDAEVSRQLGARCDVQAECDDRCLSPSPAYPGGMCTRSCDDSDGCPAEGSCSDDEGGVCLFSCDHPVDCLFLGEGWDCVTRPGRAGGEVQVCRGP